MAKYFSTTNEPKYAGRLLLENFFTHKCETKKVRKKKTFFYSEQTRMLKKKQTFQDSEKKMK